MLLSLNWLKQFVQLPSKVTPEELALQLKLHTVEVEKIDKQGALLEHVVVGKITKVEKHPDADKLKVCVVDVGPSAKAQGKARLLKVVCGGSNVREGMKVALGMIGAKVRWHGGGEPVELIKTKIRGVESEGMICASDEIGIEHIFPKKEEKEIIDLGNGEFTVGTPLAEALELTDIVFDIDHKSLSNRPDLWGHYGMAREIAAIFDIPLSHYSPPKIKEGKGMSLQVDVKDAKLCPRYMAVAITGVKVASSPEWLRNRLTAIGVRPINNIVDITNYVMLDAGQPMHAFNADALSQKSKVKSQKSVIVRRAHGGEKIKALDGKEYELSEEMLVIADTEKPIAIAGVIGGEESGVAETTDTIIFESANFDATSVRKTATALGIRTDSSARFEKGLDPTNTEHALKRAVQLTLELCPEARVTSSVVDVSDFALYHGPIELSFDFIQERVGVAIQPPSVVGILERLGFGVKTKKDRVLVTVPSWRATKDISIPEDIIEEIVRMHGYTNIPVALPSFTITPPAIDPLRALVQKFKDGLAYEAGYTEVYNYSFESPEWLTRIGVATKDYLELENPIAKDRPLVRWSLIPNLLENVEANLHRYETVKLFETGRIFTKEEAGERVKENSAELLPRQDTHLAFVYASKHATVPFYEVSGALAQLFSRLGVAFELRKGTAKDAPFIHPGRFAIVLVEGAEVGRIAELHPLTQEKLGIPYRTAFLELNLNALVPFVQHSGNYTSLPAYPVVVRDVAFVIDRSSEHSAVVEVLKKVDPLVVDAELFDVYEGKPLSSFDRTQDKPAQGKAIPEGKKSMAYHLTYRSDTRTLEAAEVEKVHAKIVEMLKKKFAAEIRIT